MTLRVKMIPELQSVQRGESGIITIIRKYAKHFPKYDMELVSKVASDFDVFAVHAGMMETPYPANVPCVSHCHGLYWTGMYQASNWEWSANVEVIKSMRHAHVITVPSLWVGETIQRDMHRNPIVVPHGVDWDEWQHDGTKENYVIGYAKNRAGQDVCNPDYLLPLAQVFPQVRFAATFAPPDVTPNVKVTGVIPYTQMKRMVQRADVFISCVRETFGIAILEAMAAGLPVLGWREGGIVDLVEHGVNGYLAHPGDAGDLYQGLDYCLKHGKQLGANGREMAKKWSWENVCAKMYTVYNSAIEKASQPPTCAVIIPSYKYAENVGFAVESVMAQTYDKLTDIVVVDDCSPDGGATERVVKTYTERDPRVKYIRLEQNSGVATARNVGISTVDTKYVCCLDADDLITPQFLQVCIEPLERDRALGISYTSMEAVLPDGRKVDTRWPPDFPVFDQQVKGKNQVPTCCVFRHELWENLAGYRPRYAPEGCGSEDAELWLRAGANGWGATKASTARMFVYSLGGNTTGRKDYKEPNWLQMHPWTKDGLHPVASIATPKHNSHPARIYDQPAISVVIPVGPGHEFDTINALDSLEGQDFRAWEAILALDGIDEKAIAPVLKAFPYARVCRTENGPKGAGAARNLGAKTARADLLCFLDADDYFLPKALSGMLDEFSKGPAIIYGDCQAFAIIEDVTKLNEKMARRIIERNPKNNKTVIRFPAANYDCELAQAMPNSDDPDSLYLVAHITCLIPKAWHNEIGGFDENMVSWEDVDWHWRLSKAGFCYRRITQDIFMYQLASGQRREIGKQNWKALLSYLRDKYERIPNMACRSCGGKSNPPPIKRPLLETQPQQKQFSDEEYIEVEYTHPNKGQHQVSGAATGTRYGQRSGGEKFLVHRDDIAAQPMYFRPVQLNNVAVPTSEVQAPPPPANIAKPEPAPVPPIPLVETPLEDEEATESIPKDLLEESTVPVPPKPIGEYDTIELNAIPGITPSIAKQMREMGLVTPRAIMDVGLDGLQNLKGVGPNRAQVIVDSVAKKIGL